MDSQFSSCSRVLWVLNTWGSVWVYHVPQCIHGLRNSGGYFFSRQRTGGNRQAKKSRWEPGSRYIPPILSAVGHIRLSYQQLVCFPWLEMKVQLLPEARLLPPFRWQCRTGHEHLWRNTHRTWLSFHWDWGSGQVLQNIRVGQHGSNKELGYVVGPQNVE